MIKKKLLGLCFLSLLPLLNSCKKDSSNETTMSESTAPKALKVIFLGNSITAGYGLADPLKAFPNVFELLAREAGHRLTVLNAGISGETSAQAIERLPLVLSSPADVLFIELGINDYLQGRSAEATARSLTTLIQRARELVPEIKIHLTDIPVSVYDPQPSAQRFQAIFPAIAREQSLSLMPAYLDKIWTNSELHLPDTLHPNEQGYAFIARQHLEYLFD